MREAGGRHPEEHFRELQEALRLVHTESVEQFLHEMAVLAARLVGGDLSCGRTMRSNGRPVTVACSDPVAATVDAVQYEIDSGPCRHAMRDGHMVRIEDTAHKARWPEFERRAAARHPVVPRAAAEVGGPPDRRPQPVRAGRVGLRRRPGSARRRFRGTGAIC